MIQTIEKWQLPDLAMRLKEATIVLLGSLSAYLIVHYLEMEKIHRALGILFIPLLFFGVWLFKKGVSSLTCVLFTGVLVYLFSLIITWA